MAERKLLTYVLMISRVFPAYHPRRGEQTYFMSKILMNYDLVVVQDDDHQFASKPGYGSKYASAFVKEMGFNPKLHTIRENYDLWVRRAEKINRGEAVLSLRQWTGSPYNYKRDGSKQVEIMQLTKIGVQKIQMEDHRHGADLDKMKNIFAVVGDVHQSVNVIAKNDGLSYEDFLYWFGYKSGKRMKAFDGCVLHFTDYRYFCTI